jgi:hypothetical protein
MLLILVIMKKDIAFVDVVCEDEADASCQGISLVPDSALEPNEEEVMDALSKHVKSDPGYFRGASQESADALTDWLLHYAGF